MRQFLCFMPICILLLSILSLSGCSITGNTQDHAESQIERITQLPIDSAVETTEKLSDNYTMADIDIFSLCLSMADEYTNLTYIASKYAGIDKLKASLALEMAFENAKHVQDQYQKDIALKNIMSVYMQMNDIGKAVQAAELISENSLIEAVIIFAKAGQFDIAESFIKKINNKDESLLFAALSYYADYAAYRGNTEKIVWAADMSLDLLNLIRDDPASSFRNGEEDSIFYTLRSIASLYAKAGKFDKSFKVAENILDPIQKCLALKDISSNYIKQNRIPESIKILDGAREILKSIGSKGNAMMLPEEIAAVYIQAGEYKDALDILVDNFSNSKYIELYEYSMSNISLLTDVVTKSAGEERKDFSDEAFITLVELAKSVEPGATRGHSLLCYAVDAFINSGITEKSEMAAAHIQIKDSKIISYINISKRYIKDASEDLQNSNRLKSKALGIICEVLEYIYSTPEFCRNYCTELLTVAEICIELELTDKADELLDMLIKQSDAIKLNDSSGNWVMESTAVLYCKIGQHTKGIEIANMAGDEDWRKDFVLDNIYRYYVEEEQISRALETIKLMKLANSRGRAYTFIADKYIKMQQQNKAIDMLDKALDEISFSIDSTKSYHNETLALFNIVDKYTELSQKDKAAVALAKSLDVIELIRERHTKVSYLADIDVKYIQSGIEIGEFEKNKLQRLRNKS